jgi:hypothetical protein
VSAFSVSTIAGDIVAHDVSRWGAQGVETGAFLLRPLRGLSLPDVVALAGANGVRREIDRFTLSGGCIDLLSEWAEDRRYRIAAQVHSHSAGAFLSPIDRVGGLRAEGFITSVVPNFTAPNPSPTSWGWWTFSGGDWRPRPVPEVTKADVLTLVFDDSGVDVR